MASEYAVVTLRRRGFLAAVLAGGSLGATRLGRVGEDPGLSVRVWYSERASRFETLHERVVGYLAAALGAARPDVTISAGRSTIALQAEDDRGALRVRWPRTVLAGVVGLGEVDRVADVNLLVTDGDPTIGPGGYGLPHVAAITGARYLARMPPVAACPAVVRYSTRAAVTHLLLHEVGHALGLDHADGAVTRHGDGIAASPMVSGYAWLDDDERERRLGGGENACGVTYATPREHAPRWLGLRYSGCARGALHS